MAKVSVIIPTYNSADYVCEAIDSVLKQTYKPLEIIVIDDGSTDHTREMVQPYITKFAVRYSYQRNCGVSSARNAGINAANGDYVAFLDADDLWASDHLDQLVNTLENHPECSIGFSAIDIFGPAKDVERNREGFKESVSRCLREAFVRKDNGVWVSNKKLMSNLLECGFPFRCPASLIRRDFFSRHNLFFDEEIEYSEDAQFMTIAAYYTPFAYVEKVGLMVRRHSGNDGDIHYGEKIAESLEMRVDKLKSFFREKLQNEEKKSLVKCLWFIQATAMRERSRNKGLPTKMKEGMKLLFKVPSYRSLKSFVKLFTRRMYQTVQS